MFLLNAAAHARRAHRVDEGRVTPWPSAPIGSLAAAVSGSMIRKPSGEM
jgi:hypothetical protein